MIGSRLERRMTLHQLRIFKSTVDQSSFTRAAAALSLSQPAVTHQLQALSRSLGHALFQTQPGRAKLALTPVGQALYERASRMLALVQETDDVIGEIVGLQTGSVRVAGDTTVGIYVVPDALSAFHRAHPHIKLRLDVVNRNRVRELLQTGEADLGILGRLWKDDVFCAEPLIQNDLMWFSAPDHPLVKREPLRLKDLVNGPLLMREPGSGTREAAETIFRKHGIEPVPDMEMASNGALKRAAAGGLGVAMFSTCAVRLELGAGLLRPLRVRGFPLRRMWHTVWMRDRLLSPAASAFRDLLRSPSWRDQLPNPLGSD
ncbi:MAG: LysR family transcriptional regulator [Candidatus Eremiobacteraeota bacterium]|nr:LysR family transcriptional regulator [Candidatus Eremiobacteraeota bacterium]MBC5807124.1 LysR family transcriptional regulator [Candidatus Eremiobacteraeota bacterium]